MAVQQSSNHPAVAARRTSVRAARHKDPESVCPRRLASLSAAVELGVEADEISLESAEERHLWEELQEEFNAFVAKIGPVWIADGPVAS